MAFYTFFCCPYICLTPWDVTSAYSVNIPSKSGLNAGTIFIILYTVLILRKFYAVSENNRRDYPAQVFMKTYVKSQKTMPLTKKKLFSIYKEKTVCMAGGNFLCIIGAGILYRDSMYFVLVFLPLCYFFITGFLIQKKKILNIKYAIE